MSNDGTPEARLTRLLEELHKRFPNVSQVMSDPPESKYLAEIDKLIDKANKQDIDYLYKRLGQITNLNKPESK